MKPTKNNLNFIQICLQQAITKSPDQIARFFKTGNGDYAQHDQFLGITNPTLRKLAQQYHHILLEEIQELLKSPYNEERFLGLVILVEQYKKGDEKVKQAVYDFYIKNLDCVNNWNLVDVSAHLIIGIHLFDKDKQTLIDLTESDNIWHRRIAIVATWWFIRQNNLDFTFIIATKLLQDNHDLIHKAVGWMLREAGKKDLNQLLLFLEKYHTTMPRTMLRYAIEKLSFEQRNYFLIKKAA